MDRTGTIIKALSGFYDVLDGQKTVVCRGRGRFRHQNITPLVGDRVKYSLTGEKQGTLEEILPRKNAFRRPAVANIDQLIIIVSAAPPVADPFLMDLMIAAAERQHCEPIICLNKSDLDPADALFSVYDAAGFTVLQVSAKTGEGLAALAKILSGKVSAFTGNSGVGKSSILNALESGLRIETGSVSQKLGRGRHTTRHVELFQLSNGAIVADTPGFSSFDTEQIERLPHGEIQHLFRELDAYIGQCRFVGCSHRREKDCAVTAALREGSIGESRYESYVRLYEAAQRFNPWDAPR